MRLPNIIPKAVPLLVMAMLCGVAPSRADDATVVTTEKLGWRIAEQLASDAVAICAEHGFAVVATVVDPGGRHQAVVRHDAAPPHSIALSYRKAYTALFYGKLFNKTTSAEVMEVVKEPSVRGALNSQPDVALIGGGVAVRKADGSFLGGLGVSGAPGGDKDEACASESIARHKSAWK